MSSSMQSLSSMQSFIMTKKTHRLVQEFDCFLSSRERRLFSIFGDSRSDRGKYDYDGGPSWVSCGPHKGDHNLLNVIMIITITTAHQQSSLKVRQSLGLFVTSGRNCVFWGDSTSDDQELLNSK